MPGKKQIAPALIGMLAAATANAQWEVEVDPFAYLMDGFSLHVAQNSRTSNSRLQGGIFQADVPEWIHGDDEFDVRMQGITLKADYFPFDETSGWFMGIDGTYYRMRYRLEQTGETEDSNQFGLGPRLGYRYEIGDDLYITPWISAQYVFNADDVYISGVRYSESDISVLPTVHLGWRF